MALTMGVHEVEILTHGLEKLGDKPCIRFSCVTVEDDPVDFMVWLTDAAMNMARASLKMCGFDVDKFNITVLDTDPTMLRGKRVTVIVEDFNGRLRANLKLNTKPNKKELLSIQGKLRAAKKEKDSGAGFETVAAADVAAVSASDLVGEGDDSDPDAFMSEPPDDEAPPKDGDDIPF